MIETVLAGTYRVVRKIGAGGMADVYEVEHLRLGSRFAAKVARTLTRDEATHRRFSREARMLASLKSDHIVVVFDVSGPEVDPPFMIMELLDGRDLRELLRDVPKLPISRAAKLVCDACFGLVAVHAAGVIHRDLKPENLFVTHRDDGEEYCKLLDFGVMKAEQGTSTQHGGLIGTIKYMAPEQIEHAGLVTARSDVRSLAAILYECLAGAPPFEAPTVEQLLFRVLNEVPKPIRSVRADVSPELDAIVMRALAREPSSRFASAREFADALRPFTRASALDLDTTRRDAELPLIARVSSGSRAGRGRAARALGVAGFATAVALALGAVLAWRTRPPATDRQQPASSERDEHSRASKPQPDNVLAESSVASASSPSAAPSFSVAPSFSAAPSFAVPASSSTPVPAARAAKASPSAVVATGGARTASHRGMRSTPPSLPSRGRAHDDVAATTAQPPRALSDGLLHIDSKSPYEHHTADRAVGP